MLTAALSCAAALAAGERHEHQRAARAACSCNPQIPRSRRPLRSARKKKSTTRKKKAPDKNSERLFIDGYRQAYDLVYKRRIMRRRS